MFGKVLMEKEFEEENESKLGIAIAQHLQWKVLPILKTFYAAMKDANIHTENKTVAKWIKKEEAMIQQKK